MADNQLDKIAGLAKIIEGLGNKKRGMPIEAEDWNGMVAVLQGLLEIDRTQEDLQKAALAQSFAPLQHEHLGQVTMAWLDADLQAKVGAASSPANILQHVSQLEAQLAGINHELARLSGLFDAHQTAIDRFSINDLNRAKAVRDFDARIGTLNGIQTAVAAISTDLTGVKSNIDTVLELRNTLTGPDGAPLDVFGMKQDIAGLQSLRDNLKGVDGNLLRLAEIEVRLKGVEDASGTGVTGGLEGRINVAVGAAEERLKVDQTTRINMLREQLTAEATQRNEVFGTGLQKAVDAKLAAAAQSNKTLVEQTAGQLRTENADKLATAIAGAKQEQTAETKAFVAHEMAAIPGQIGAAITNARLDILKAAQESAVAQARAVLDTALPAAEERINAKLNTAITVVQQNQAASETRLRTDLSTSIGKLRDEFKGTIDTRFTALDQTLSTSIDTRVKSTFDAALPGITASTQTALDQRLSTLDAKISQSVADATKSVPDTIGSQLRLQLTQLNLPAQITAATAQVTQQFRTELATAVSAQQDRATTALNAAMTQLRGETVAAVKAGTDDVFTRAGALMGSVRNELATTANGLRTEFQTSIRTETQKLSNDFSSRIARLPGRGMLDTDPGVVVRPLNP